MGAPMKKPMARSKGEAKTAVATQRSEVLTKATCRAATRLGLGQAELAKVIGLSPASTSRMFAGTWTIQEQTKPWELSALLVRVFRSLDAVIGGNETQVKQWFQADNSHLGATPADLILSIEGLTNVARYLDAMRGAQ
jgi:hypothetical protein